MYESESVLKSELTRCRLQSLDLCVSVPPRLYPKSRRSCAERHIRPRLLQVYTKIGNSFIISYAEILISYHSYPVSRQNLDPVEKQRVADGNGPCSKLHGSKPSRPSVVRSSSTNFSVKTHWAPAASRKCYLPQNNPRQQQHQEQHQ